MIDTNEQIDMEDANEYTLKSASFWTRGKMGKLNVFFVTMIHEKKPTLLVKVEFSNDKGDRSLYREFHADKSGKRINLPPSVVYILAHKIKMTMEDAKVLEWGNDIT